MQVGVNVATNVEDVDADGDCLITKTGIVVLVLDIHYYLADC